MTRTNLSSSRNPENGASLSTPEVATFIEQLRDCRSLLGADAACRLSARSRAGFEEVDTNRYSFRGHDIVLGLSFHLAGQAQLLGALEGWNLNTLPHRIAEVHFNSKEMALVTRVGTPEARPLVPLHRWKEAIEPAHISAVHADIENLAGQGVMNRAFRSGLATWSVEPSSGRIIIPAPEWRLEVFRREELDALHARVDETFALVEQATRHGR